MSEFLAILSVYYMCNAAAAERQLSAAEVATCTARYEAVKAHFADSAHAADAPAQNLSAYRNFKTWERENADLVADLRAAARTSATLH